MLDIISKPDVTVNEIERFKAEILGNQMGILMKDRTRKR